MELFKNQTFSPIEFSKKVIFIIWLLVFSKCFILEYYIRLYELPIQSHFYIWGLSLLLVSTASYLFWNRSRKQGLIKEGSIKIRSIFNLLLFISFVLASLLNYYLYHLDSRLIFSLLLALFSFYLLNNGLFLNHLIQIISGFLTLIAIYPIYHSSTPSIYLYISILLMLIATPFIVELIYYRKITKRNQLHLNEGYKH